MSSEPTLPVLTPSLVNRDEFLGLFYDEVQVAVGAKASVGVHVLRIDGGDLTVGDMYKTLHNASLGYVLSRDKRKEVTEANIMEISSEVHGRFRFPETDSGEGGEMLLYAFLEGHLNAPKILTKMELKTAKNDYIKGSDGIHLLEKENGSFALIFGESKMYADSEKTPSLQGAIYAAFKSMAKVRDGFFEMDTWLVGSHLLKEAADEKTLEALAKILLPNAKTGPKKDNAFGVLFGYEIDATSWDRINMTAEEIEEKIKQSAHGAVLSQVDYIKKRMVAEGLEGFNFYVYAIPFLKTMRSGQPYGIEQVRIELAEKLTHEKYVAAKKKEPKK